MYSRSISYNEEESVLFFEVFPWQNGGDWLKEHANLYFHCIMREREEACELMSDNGWLLMHQQAWDFAQQLPGHPEPKYAQYLKHNLA